MGTDRPSIAELTNPTYVHDVVEMNQALILGAVHQHELTEASESLNAQLRAEIEQREQAERALRESEERFRSLFACAPMAVFACDRHWVIQQCNSRAVDLWGRAPACGVEVLCGSLRLWLPDGQLLALQEDPFAEVLRSGLAPLTLEVSIERFDGSRVPVQASFAALKNGAGRITGTIASFMDLTERKKMEQQTLRAQRMESIVTLAGGIAHNLNNSLGPILMSIDLLKATVTDAAGQELLALIGSSAERGAETVQQVLAFARGAGGKRVEVQVSQLVRDIERSVNETFPRPIQVEMSIRAGLWPVMGDPAQLHQALLNLCLNSRDAMPNGGILAVFAENRQLDAGSVELGTPPKAEPGCFVVLEVKDSGTGMSAKTMENIFDPFFTTKEFGTSSGLGLPTSLAIVKSHGGFLHVDSEPGKGTTVQVFLPAQAEVSLPALPPPVSERPRGNGELILVVDDEPIVRTVMRRTLEDFGYRVVIACDGAEAVAIYNERCSEISAVITDMTMPVMEGPELIRILRTRDLKLPIIAASGLASSTYAAQLASLGVEHILSKPFKAGTLLKMLRQILEDRGLDGGAQPPLASR